jgi:hypothetical protein
MFFYTLEERGPFHEICEVEVEVIVFGEGVQVAEVEFQEVARAHSADGRHRCYYGLEDTISSFQRSSNLVSEMRVPEKKSGRSQRLCMQARQRPPLAQAPRPRQL